jgi:tetratricopeptide (TPR) repeat protein
MVETLIELADLYVLTKDYPKAVEKYERVIQSSPQHPLTKRAYLGLEEVYQNLGRSQQAEKVLKELVDKFPQDDVRFEGFLRLGRLYSSQKRFGVAIPPLSTALKSPEERIASEAQLRLGEAYLGSGNQEMALLQFSRAVYLYPHRPEVFEESLLQLGTLYLEGGKPSEAKKIYRAAGKTRREDRRQFAKRMLDQIDRGATSETTERRGGRGAETS